MTGQETLIAPGAYMLPGEYLKNCVEPFACNVNRQLTVPDRIKQAMLGKGWLTIAQISTATGFTDNSIRATLRDMLQHDGTFEKKDGPPSTRGPRIKLWRWKSRGSVQ